MRSRAGLSTSSNSSFMHSKYMSDKRTGTQMKTAKCFSWLFSLALQPGSLQGHTYFIADVI